MTGGGAQRRSLRLLVAALAVSSLAAGLAVIPAGPAGATGPLALSVGSVTVIEGDATSSGSVQAKVPIALTAPIADENLEVTFTITPGTATANVDYKAPPASKTFRTWVIPAGQVVLWVPVQVLGDTDDENDETVFVTVTAVSGEVLITNDTGTVTIVDDDPGAAPSVGIGDVSIIEGDQGSKPVTVPITLSAPQPVSVELTWAIVGGDAVAGSDYMTTGGNITIPANRTRAFLDKVKILGDIDGEPDETIQILITSAPTGVTISRSLGTITLLTDDAPS